MNGSYRSFSTPGSYQSAAKHNGHDNPKPFGTRNEDPKTFGQNRQGGENTQHQNQGDLKSKWFQKYPRGLTPNSSFENRGSDPKSFDSGLSSLSVGDLYKEQFSSYGGCATTTGDKQETEVDRKGETLQQREGRPTQQNEGNGLHSDFNESFLGLNDLDANLANLLKHVNHLNQSVKKDHTHHPVDVEALTNGIRGIYEQNCKIKEDRDKYLNINSQLVEKQKAVHEMIESLCCKIVDNNKSTFMDSVWNFFGRKTGSKDIEIETKFEHILRFVQNIQTNCGKQESVIENILTENETLKKNLNSANQRIQHFDTNFGEQARKLFISQEANSDLINKVEAKTNAFNELHRNFNENSEKLADARNTISHLLSNLEIESNALQKAHKENDYLKTKFNSKTAAQIEQIKQKDEQYQKLQDDLKFEKRSHERLMKEKNIFLKNSDRYHTEEMQKLNNKLLDQLKINEKICKEKLKAEKDLETSNKRNQDTKEKNQYEMAKLQSILSDLEKRLKEEEQLNQEYAITNLKLQQSASQRKNDLEKINREKENLQHSLDQETQTKEKLSHDLQNLKSAIFAQTSHLKDEKVVFRNKLQQIAGQVVKYSKKISPELVEDAENNSVKEALEAIANIRGDAEKFKARINSFHGNREHKTYLDVKEMLVRIIVKLDNVDSQNKEEIRKRRRSAIVFVKELQDELEKRVNS